MAEFYSDEEIKTELDSSVNREKQLAFAGRKYPIELLSSREFEILLYFIYKKEISSGILSDKYDFILLMKGVAEKGRDIILQKQSESVGVIQCKRYLDTIQKPELAREIIKFLLHSLQDVSLISDSNNFTYYFVALNGFNDKALELLQNFNDKIIKEQKLKIWTEEVLSENKSLKFKSFEEVQERLKEILYKIKVEPISGVDIDHKLKNAKDILAIFFEVEKVASEAMLDAKFEKYFDFVNDEDLERLRKRLKDLPKENRMTLGFFSLFGFDENFCKTIANNRNFLLLIADLKGKFNERFIDYLKETIEKYHFIFIAGLPIISPFTKQAIVPYLFSKYSSQFFEIEFGKVFTQAIKEKESGIVHRQKTMDDIKKRLLDIGEKVLLNDFSSFVGDGEILKLKKELVCFTHKEFKTVQEMSERFDKDMIILKPYIERIEEYIKTIMPKNPTIVIENLNMLDSNEAIEKLAKESKRFDNSK